LGSGPGSGTPANRTPKKPDTGPDWQSSDPFSGSTGNGVHAHGKFVGLGLFFKTGQKEGHKNLQNSGPVRATDFRKGDWMWVGLKRALLDLRFAGCVEQSGRSGYGRAGPSPGFCRLEEIARVDEHIRPFPDDRVNR